jgi:hypothetical protein
MSLTCGGRIVDSAFLSVKDSKDQGTVLTSIGSGSGWAWSEPRSFRSYAGCCA